MENLATAKSPQDDSLTEEQEELLYKKEIPNNSTELTNILEKCASILRQDRSQWQLGDRELVHKCINRIKYFNKDMLGDHDLMRDYFYYLSNLFGYVEYDAGDVIFHYHEHDPKFYVILTGQVNLFAPKTKEDLTNDFRALERQASNAPDPDAAIKRLRQIRDAMIEEAPNELAAVHYYQQKAGAHLPGRRSSISYMSEVNQSIQDTEVLKLDPTKQSIYFEKGIVKFKKIKKISQGEYFGDVHHHSVKGHPVAAVAKTKVALISIPRVEFVHLHLSHIVKMRQKIDNFSKKFENVPHNMIIKFCQTFKEQEFKIGHRFFHTGDQATHFYLLKSGEVEILKGENKSPSKYDQIFITDPDGSPKRSTAARVSLFNSGEFFGEEELVTRTNRVTTAAVISNTCLVYVISYDDFVKVAQTDMFTELVEAILERARLKSIWRLKRILELQALEEQNNGAIQVKVDPVTSSIRTSSHEINTIVTVGKKLPRRVPGVERERVDASRLLQIVQRNERIAEKLEVQTRMRDPNITVPKTHNFIDFGLIKMYGRVPLYQKKSRYEKFDAIITNMQIDNRAKGLAKSKSMAASLVLDRPKSAYIQQSANRISLEIPEESSSPNIPKPKARPISALFSKIHPAIPEEKEKKRQRPMSSYIDLGEWNREAAIIKAQQQHPLSASQVVAGSQSQSQVKSRYYIKGDFHSRSHLKSGALSTDSANLRTSMTRNPSAQNPHVNDTPTNKSGSLKKLLAGEKTIMPTYHNLFRFKPARNFLRASYYQ